ncbi:hypothetical protein [Streptomyces sp. A012304]|uniref:hypothetical protein n=1 Tax=Streptomyces sp. A012304 TaxID=375446 RepID=UPI002231E500|nr:hypothetical protein [Streptomyces sp. A012304]GKQ40007.1 hypothetical protein ALMP_65330 [Streptomyces sp. A012304]
MKATTLLAGALWTVTMTSLAWLTFLIGMVAVWLAAEGEPVGGFLLRYGLIYAAFAAVLSALASAPGIRRLDVSARLLLLGVLAAPAPTALALWTWVNSGA